MGEHEIDRGEGSFEGRKGVNIYYRYYRPIKVKGAIVLVHGFGEHSGRYEEMCGYFADFGLAVYIMDLRGHGRSGGPRWNPEIFDYYIYDLKKFVDMTKRSESVDRVFMLAHSLGGMIALKYAIVHGGDLIGLIVSGPGLGYYMPLPIIGRVNVSITVLKIFEPLLAIGAKLLPNVHIPGTQVNKPPSQRADDGNAMDPLVCYDLIKLRFAYESCKNVVWLRRNGRELKVPCLFLSGSRDTFVPFDAIKEFYDRAEVEDKDLISYKGFNHQIFKARDKEIVYRDITKWLTPRL